MPLLGNHDLMMVWASRSPEVLPFWLQCGGDKTLESYGVRLPADLPAEHLAFLGKLSSVPGVERVVFRACELFAGVAAPAAE